MVLRAESAQAFGRSELVANGAELALPDNVYPFGLPSRRATSSVIERGMERSSRSPVDARIEALDAERLRDPAAGARLVVATGFDLCTLSIDDTVTCGVAQGASESRRITLP